MTRLHFLLLAFLPIAVVGGFAFGTLSYALRDLVRTRLAAYLEEHGRERWLEPIVDHRNDLILITAAGRLLCNTLILVAVLRLMYDTGWPLWAQYGGGAVVAGLISLVLSVLIPHALARHAGDALVGQFAGPLDVLRRLLRPLTALNAAVDRLVRQAAGNPADAPAAAAEAIEQEILSVVEEGEEDGVVDERAREMIEGVISFGDTTAGQIMSARPEIVAVDVSATLAQVKAALEQSGHSRLPVYRGTLDQIVGVLYARDLLKHLGEPAEPFAIAPMMRPALFVPETKPLRDLLSDFRLQKVHLAIVLDEYGGTAGLVTIEDIVEEIVGDISDEHEPTEPAMLQPIGDHAWSADARVYLDELNRAIGLDLPEDAGYDTLGGFVSTTLGRIPERGTTFDHGNARFTILNAEPQKVSRVKIELMPDAVAEPARR